LRTKSTTKVALSRRLTARRSRSRPRTAVLCIAAGKEDAVQSRDSAATQEERAERERKPDEWGCKAANLQRKPFRALRVRKKKKRRRRCVSK
jgi:hypothetical protein